MLSPENIIIPNEHLKDLQVDDLMCIFIKNENRTICGKITKIEESYHGESFSSGNGGVTNDLPTRNPIFENDVKGKGYDFIEMNPMDRGLGDNFAVYTNSNSPYANMVKGSSCNVMGGRSFKKRRFRPMRKKSYKKSHRKSHKKSHKKSHRKSRH